MADQYTDLLRRELDAGRTPAELWVMAADLVRGGRLARADAETILGPEPTAAELAVRVAALKASERAKRLTPPPAEGVGTEAELIFKQLDFQGADACPACRKLRDDMNRAGVAGCRQRRPYFVAQLRARQKALSWQMTLRAAWRAVRTGLVRHIRPWNVAGSIFDLAIRRAAAKAGGG